MKYLKQFLLILVIILSALQTSAFQVTSSLEDLELTSELKELVKDNIKEVVFLYGVVCVGGCPIGNYIFSVKDREDIVYIVPSFYSKNDIANLQRGMFLMGKIHRASESNAEFLKKLAKLMKLDDWQQNFVIDVDDYKIVDARHY